LRRASDRAAEGSEVLEVAGELGATWRDRVLHELAVVAGHRTASARTVDANGEPDSLLFASDERRTELLVELSGDRNGDRPGQDGEVERFRDRECGTCRGSMIRVPGDATVEASPRVKQTWSTVVPCSTNAVTTAPRPKDSSSGCAHTRRAGGRADAHGLGS